MKRKVYIDYMDGKSEGLDADRVELLNIGEGVLSVINDRMNTCTPLFNIRQYCVIDQKEDED